LVAEVITNYFDIINLIYSNMLINTLFIKLIY